MLGGTVRRLAHYNVWREDLKYIYPGHEAAAHTLTHPNLTALEDAEIIRQVEQDRQNLSELAGYEVVGMAYPCGSENNNDRVAGIIKNHTGIQYSRTIAANQSTALQKNLYRFDPTFHVLEFDSMMALGKEFLASSPDTPQILYIRGHSCEMDIASEYWVKLEEFFRLISNRPDIFYGTNQEVLL